MQTIKVYTRFDITNTDIIRPFNKLLLKAHSKINSEENWIKARRQQSNFETLIQIISLRTQPTILYKPVMKISSLIKFNNNKKGKVWNFSFTIEHNGVYSDGLKVLGLLETDCRHVPMNLNLNETILDNYLVIDKNIYFEIVNDF